MSILKLIKHKIVQKINFSIPQTFFHKEFKKVSILFTEILSLLFSEDKYPLNNILILNCFVIL